MSVNRKPLTALTAGDLMTRNVIWLAEEMPLRDAARLLREAQVSGAPVVDKHGRCVGVLSAADFLRWAEGEDRGVGEVPTPACRYQVKGRLLTGGEAVICILAEGKCPLQTVIPTTGGRHTALCFLPGVAPGGPRSVTENVPRGAVRRYMTTDIITTGPATPLPKLARMMINCHIHRIIVVDPQDRPVGIVSSTDALAALAGEDSEP